MDMYSGRSFTARQPAPQSQANPILRNTGCGILCGVLFSLFFTQASAQDVPASPPRQLFAFSPVIPSDVDPAQIGTLMKEGKVAQAQRAFDVFSWQQFLAMNWPTGEQGKSAPVITDTAFGPPAWLRWHESSEVFREQGQPPAPGELLAAKPSRQAVASRHGVALGSLSTTDRSTRVLSIVSATQKLTSLDDTQQAFSHPIWDQNGNVVFYEILLNDAETQYIVQNKLYNLDGQIAFASNHNAINLPAGIFNDPGQVGAIELKLAWKVLDAAAGDNAQRYFTSQAVVLDGYGKSWRKVTVGLVGMHISHKTGSSPQWVWSTFEHVDNLQVNSLDTVTVDGKEQPLRASFNNADCETCLVNTYPPAQDAATGKKRTQIARAVPIPDATRQLNEQVQSKLREIKSVWQYYELINTQWPTDPSAPPTTPGPDTLPGSVENKSGGKPTPVFLTNSVMETYFQGGNQTVGTQEEGSPAGPEERLFATESCMGCHYSAGIANSFTTSPDGTRTAVFSGPKTSDFSWLFQMRAAFQPYPTAAPQTQSAP
ncbi:hypothetical protein V2J67_00080 [Pseudomonas alliivorans]|nr:hypothetical protein [Pseudomonas alliivorans]